MLALGQYALDELLTYTKTYQSHCGLHLSIT